MSKKFVLLAFFAFLINYGGICEEMCPKAEKNESEQHQKCIWIEKGKPSIIVKGSSGRLGNVLFSYLILLGIKVTITVCCFKSQTLLLFRGWIIIIFSNSGANISVSTGPIGMPFARLGRQGFKVCFLVRISPLCAVVPELFTNLFNMTFALLQENCKKKNCQIKWVIMNPEENKILSKVLQFFMKTTLTKASHML